MSLRIVALLCALLPFSVHAADINLATVPPRKALVVTIYNAEDLTLVQENHTVSLQPGNNVLQFSWAHNTRIDPTSISLNFVNPAPGLDVSSTRFPHAQAHQLQWRVHSPDQRSAQIEVSYFTAGLQWSAHYHAITSPTAHTLALTGDVQISNQSGQDYPEARIRLVIGRVHLLQRIAELAGMPITQLGRSERSKLRQQAARSLMLAEAKAPAAAPPVIHRQPLAAYHIYSIAGHHTLRTGWRVRLRNFRAPAAPYRIDYRYRPRQYGAALVRVLQFHNNKAAALGETPLPGGMIQVYRQDTAGRLQYLASEQLPYTPVGAKISVNLGPDPEVRLQTVPLRVFRDNVWLKLHGTNIYRRADQPGLQVDLPAKVAGWNSHETVEQRIRNGHDHPIELQLRLRLAGDVSFRSQLEATLYDAHTVNVTATAAPARMTALRYEVSRRHGHNQRQDQVTLTTGVPRLTPPPAR